MSLGDIVNIGLSDMILLSALVLAHAPLEPAQPPQLGLVGLGRFAVLADISTRKAEGGTVVMRSLQVSEEDLLIGPKRYIGGWSWWRFDCADSTAERLDYASLTSDLIEGPQTPIGQPPYPISPGGDAAELFDIACGHTSLSQTVGSVPEAVTLARKAMAN